MPFVPNDDGLLNFNLVPGSYTLDRSRKKAGFDAWRDYFRHGKQVWRAASNGADKRSGVLTSFPQLPVTVGVYKRLAFSDRPVVAWTFNLGRLYPGIRRLASRAGLVAVNKFIVHSKAEITAYSEWLDIPPERFVFVPFETPIRSIEYREDVDNPFILSMGSAQRDYRLLLGVLGELKYPALIVAAPHAVAGLTIPANVTVRSGLTPQQCFELLQRARFTVIPVANKTTASGQVTLLDAMMYARPAIITECPASIDYVTHGKDAWLVKQGDHDDLKGMIRQAWEDDALRAAVGASARRQAVEHFSEPVIGRAMGNLLREVATSVS